MLWPAQEEEGSAEASGSAEKLMLELCLVPWIHQALLSLPIIKRTGSLRDMLAYTG